MFINETFIRVRYAETDQMGFVYYGVYAQYYEVGRVEMIRSLGLRYKDLEDSGIIMPVLDMKSFFHKPARYDDLLKVVTKLPKLPQSRIYFTYEISNEKEEIIHHGETTLFFASKLSLRPCATPKVLLEVLNPYFSNI